jgi:hypothetical protein
MMSIQMIFEEILAERKRQDQKWGEQNHPIMPSSNLHWFPTAECLESTLKGCRKRLKEDEGENKSWFDILHEEVLEAFLEEEPEKQREEMVQAAAVAVAIIEYLDRENNRKGGIA